ncbi:hypothetical protein AV521_41545 [Streptomyces sp. IMTB 2501]|uniref:FAD/NAD(P)-binding protein n=1 Tax=Streptomyces sp. IMTB 2501 TaxID=1776340 RepID=UPI00096DC9CB|nr:FAD/NAD(P)-binding domain-containing protein [Streptomyces sp. IMTB 2501]OLZ62607.1 hypothetical protein AV521_41545 [Streptomyces sp. IMTB 2501]
MNTARVTIAGTGPRGLGVLQRIADRARRLPDGTQLEIHLVDPSETGQGAHPARQPDYLLTNTLASQLSMFSDGQGPSFTEWAEQAGYRRFGSGYCRTGGEGGEPIGELDYLPRSMLGAYLSFVFDRTAQTLPPSIRLVHHRSRVIDMEEVAAGGMLVRTEDGFRIPSDFVFLTTGHCRRIASDDDVRFESFVSDHRDRNDRLCYAADPYPIDRLQRIAPGSVVAVQGLGLTAHDVLAALTVGRGGRFEGDGDGMRYLPSGREPRILLMSRQCLPAAARGINQKGVAGRYEPQFFTPQAVAALRQEAQRTRGTQQLDFDREVLPLLLREMGYAWRTTLEKRPVPPQEYTFGDEDRAAVEAILDPLAGRGFASAEEFTAFFTAFVSEDLAEAERGNLTSPVKAATDVIRDVRESLRQAVDFAGLTPASHRVFTQRWVPLMNRISFGPPRRRNYELLSLMRAGTVDLAGGPGCRVDTDEATARFTVSTDFAGGSSVRHADVLVAARLDVFHPDTDSSPLVSRLLARGLIRPFANGDYEPGGLDITPSGRVVAKTGDPLAAVWALGYPVEGPRYYTYYVPRAGQATRFAAEAAAAVDDMWAQLADPPEEDRHDDQQR